MKSALAGLVLFALLALASCGGSAPTAATVLSGATVSVNVPAGATVIEPGVFLLGGIYWALDDAHCQRAHELALKAGGGGVACPSSTP